MNQRVADLRPETGPSGPQGDAVQILLQVTESMTAAGGTRRALNRLASLALEATGADRCAILVRDTLGQRRLLPAAAASRIGRPDELWQRFRAMQPVDVAADPARRVLWDAVKAVVIDDAADSPIIPPEWQLAWGSKSLACANLRVAGETFGLLAVDYVREHHSFSASEAALLEAIADAAAVSLRAARLVEELERAVEIQRRLGECTAAIRSGLPLPEVLDLVADGFSSLLRSASSFIYLLDESEGTMTQAAARGAVPAAPEMSVEDLPATDVANIREVWEKDPRTPIRVPDLRDYPQWRGIVPPGIRTGMLVPLAEGDHVIGFVAVGRKAPPFSHEEVRVASAFADHAAVAVTQARLAETLTARLRLTEALLRLSGLVPRTSGFRSMLSALNRAVCADIGVRCEHVTFLDDDLVRLLRLRPPLPQEVALIRSWRRDRNREPVIEGADAAVPVWMQGRPAGILRAHLEHQAGIPSGDVLKGLADGIGEVAFKAKLRITAQRRGEELAIAADREVLARELHDTVGQTLFGLALGLQNTLWEEADPALRGRVAELRGLAGDGIAQLRNAVLSLSLLRLRSGGLVRSLRALAGEVSDSLAVPVTVHVSGVLPSMSEPVERALYRLAHEALVNIDRESRATGIVLTLEARNGQAELSIRDDGVGLDQRQVADWRSAVRFGLRMASKTLEEAGGRLHVTPAMPRGLLIKGMLPLDDPRSALLL